MEGFGEGGLHLGELLGGVAEVGCDGEVGAVSGEELVELGAEEQGGGSEELDPGSLD